MFDRTIASDPRPAAPQSRAIYRMRDGHRREYDASRDRGSTSFRERCRGALADIGIYAPSRTAISPRLTSAAIPTPRGGGERLDTRRARPRNPSHWTQRQPVQGADPHAERRAEARKRPPSGESIPARRSGSHVPGPPKPRTTRPSTGSAARERQRLLERGAAIRRVRLDGELKSAVARRSESARVRDGRRAADAERHRAAGELGLPIDAQGRVLYPDAQIEYTDSEGRTGRVNIEVASGNYRAHSIRAKVAAGFRDARQRTGRGAPAPLARRGQRRRSLLPARAGRAGSGRARALARPHATLEDQRGADPLP